LTYKMLALIIAVFFFLISLPAKATDWDQHPYDKYTHIAIGGAISCAVTAKTDNRFYGFISALTVGILKEVSDKNFNNKDAASWGVGGVIGTFCYGF